MKNNTWQSDHLQFTCGCSSLWLRQRFNTWIVLIFLTTSFVKWSLTTSLPWRRSSSSTTSFEAVLIWQSGRRGWKEEERVCINSSFQYLRYHRSSPGGARHLVEASLDWSRPLGTWWTSDTGSCSGRRGWADGSCWCAAPPPCPASSRCAAPGRPRTRAGLPSWSAICS